MFLFQRKDSKNKAHLQSSVGDYPKSLHSLNMKSVGFVFPVGWVCVPGRLGLCPWSVVLSGTGDARMHRMPKTVAGPGQKCGPGTQTQPTGDGTCPDLGRKDSRTTAGRRQARRQDEGRHGTCQEQAKNAGNGWDVGKNDYICGISTDINLLTL